MTLMRPPVMALAMVLVLAVLAGCSPQLEVSPRAITFGATGTASSIIVRNVGTGTLTWSFQEVVRVDEAAPWTEQDISWLSADTPAGPHPGYSPAMIPPKYRRIYSMSLSQNIAVESLP